MSKRFGLCLLVLNKPISDPLNQIGLCLLELFKGSDIGLCHVGFGALGLIYWLGILKLGACCRTSKIKNPFGVPSKIDQ